MELNRRLRRTVVMLWGLVLVAGPAAAQQQSNLQVGAERPWARGVSPERQRSADALFQEGNQALLKSAPGIAAPKYEEALKLWDHPAIHYNLALALVDAGRPLEMHEHLEAALRYGEGPLDRDMLERARILKSLVEQQLVRVEISCEVAGTSVRMDREELFLAPGHFEGWVLPGTHVINAIHEGYPANERLRTPRGGEKISLHLSKLYTDEDLTRDHRRWDSWKSWAVVGAGAALAAGGGVLHLQARNSYRDFDARAEACGLAGCDPSPDFERLRSRGDTFQKVAVGTYVAGGAVIATGVVLAILNRAESYRLTPDEYEKGLQIDVQAGSRESGVMATFHF